MEFCILSPIAGLERYATLSRTHLLLPQLDKLPGYREFYLKRAELGDFLILDNGAYEGCEDWTLLKECIKIYKPNVVALPDFMSQCWDKTFWAAQRFLDEYYEDFPWVQWMFIPQAVAGDFVGWVAGLNGALDDSRIKWVGLPRALTYTVTNDLMSRVNAARSIHRSHPHIKLHALGMAKGSLEELNALKQLGYVSSIDSNAPVWRGWKGYSLYHQWPEIPCNYQEEFAQSPVGNGPQRREQILHNLEACGVDTTGVRERNNSQRKTLPGG